MAWSIPTDPVPLRVDEGGNVRVGPTRVTLATVVSQFNNGASPELIAEWYDTLELADVYAVLAHYLRHRDEIDTVLAREDAEAEAYLLSLGSRYRKGGEPSGQPEGPAHAAALSRR